MADDLCKNKKQRQRTVEEALAMGYELSDGVFKFQGVACVPGNRLRELCFPDDIEDPEKRKLAVEEADRLFASRAWLSAHWTFYHLPNQHLKLRTLKGMRYDLGELVKMGVVSSPAGFAHSKPFPCLFGVWEHPANTHPCSVTSSPVERRG